MTALWLRRLKATNSGRIEYSDTIQSGLRLRVGKTTMTWVCVYRITGNRKLKRMTIGRYPAISLADARKVARDTIVQAEKGNDPSAEKQKHRQEQLKAPTFQILADTYMKYHAKRHKKESSIKEDQRILNKELLPVWKNLKAKDIKRRDVIALLDEVAERGPVMANRVLALASTIFNIGIDRELIEANPCYRLRKPGGSEKSRDRVLSPDELKAIWKAFDALRPLMRYNMRIRLFTAQRGGEICAMAWDDIDLDKKTWTIPGYVSKNKKAHRVPLTMPVMEILKTLHKTSKTKWVFPSNHGSAYNHITSVQKAAQKVQAESKVLDFKLHDMRRTAASMMAEMGISEFDIGKVLNHTNESITAVYNRHSYDNEKRHALEKWANKLEQILAGKQAKVVNLTTHNT